MKSPNLHKWNGVGGKIEKGEDPLKSIIREVREETGLTVYDLSYRGIVSWNGKSGMHVYRADFFSGEVLESEEGPLEWKTIEWIRQSTEIVSNIPIFLDHLLSDHPPIDFSFTYLDERIVSYNRYPLKIAQA
ncbi:NUDIX domain-containing protein [Bacillus sp. AK128]